MSDPEFPRKNAELAWDNAEAYVGSVFYVDDDVVVRSSIARRLIRRGYLVREINSGEELVSCLQEEQDSPDVILLDYKMPGMDGLETFNAIRPICPHTPVILFTAYPGALNVEEAKRQGLLDVLTKNVELDNIIGMLQLAIDSKKE